MGVLIPQVVTGDKASGAQVIEGSLKFDSATKGYLKRTPSSGGNQKTFTLSCWFKRGSTGQGEFFVVGSDNNNRTRMFFLSDDKLNFYNKVSSTLHDDDQTRAIYRDTSSFYHVVFSIDCANTTGSIYVNGDLQETFTTVDTNTMVNSTSAHYIGGQVFNDNNYYHGSISQLYMIDGQALDASYFGFTDPLTNTWRPKKFDINDTPTASWGTNGFYLPFDGSAPIEKDQSGNGNDWSLRVVGGSTRISKATGALPILDTASDGKTALPTVRGSVGVAVTVAAKTGGGNAFYIDGVLTHIHI